MRRITLVADIDWIRKKCGGRSGLPIVGLRPMIRWQRYIKEWLSAAWDVEIMELHVESGTRHGTVKLRFSEKATIAESWLQAGELIELLDGYRVIGVGAIIGCDVER